MLSPADASYVRIKIIKRFGDMWVYLAFYVCACIIRNAYEDVIANPDDCTYRLIRFLNLFYYGYSVYVGFMIATLIGCIYPQLDTLFRIIQVFVFVGYFFAVLLYANLAAYTLDDICKTQNLEIWFFCLAYIVAWYVFLGTRLLMLVMYGLKKSFSGRHHELEGVGLFIDAE